MSDLEIPLRLEPMGLSPNSGVIDGVEVKAGDLIVVTVADAAPTLGENPKDRLGIKKPGTHLIPGSALLHLGVVMSLGAKKYGPYNWRENAVKASVYLDAMERHRLLFIDGQTTDPESGASHLAHIMACCAILIDAYETGNLVDDLDFEPGAVEELIARFNATGSLEKPRAAH